MICGRLFVFLGLASLLIGMSGMVAANDNDDAEEGTRVIQMPEIERKFIGLVCKAKGEHYDASNDLKKFNIQKQLDRDLKKLFAKSKKILKWVGSVGLTEVDSKGRVALVTNLPPPPEHEHCLLMIGNFEQTGLLKKRYFTTIQHGNRLFGELSKFDIGGEFKFSGSFVANKKGALRKQQMDAYYIRLTKLESL